MHFSFSLTASKFLLWICNPASSDASVAVPPRSSTSRSCKRMKFWSRKPTISQVTKPENVVEPLSESTTLAVRSPLSELPPEIMAEIFATVCHATSHKFHSDKRRHLRTTPLILGHVCILWREIVWTTPNVWSHVPLVLSTTRYDTQMTILHDWFKHSGVCPLHINLLFESENDWTGKIPKELLEMLIETSHRWRKIYFVLPEAWYAELEQIRTNIPLLVSASTQPLWSDCGLPSSRRRRFDLLQSAPALTDMHLNGYYFTDVSIPWAQLTSFTMQHIYLDECLYGLARIPNVKYCRIYTILDNDVGRIINDYPSRLELPFTELVIYSVSWSDNARLLSNLFLPSLRKLELSCLEGQSAVSNLPLLFLNLGCNLQKLKLTELTCEDEESDLIGALQQIPTLRALEITLARGPSSISGPAFFPAILQMHPTTATENTAKDDAEIAPNSSIDPYLGKLEEFKFSGHITVEKSVPFEEQLLDALQLRIKASGSCLRLFEMVTSHEYHRSVDPDVKKDFQELCNEGLQLKISFGDISWIS